jgi:hypothetical protein
VVLGYVFHKFLFESFELIVVKVTCTSEIYIVMTPSLGVFLVVTIVANAHCYCLPILLHLHIVIVCPFLLLLLLQLYIVTIATTSHYSSL